MVDSTGLSDAGPGPGATKLDHLAAEDSHLLREQDDIDGQFTIGASAETEQPEDSDESEIEQ